MNVTQFLRIEFICIIWTDRNVVTDTVRSWGLNLFVLFEQVLFKYSLFSVLEDWIYLYYLNTWYFHLACPRVLEDWIYLYYLNIQKEKLKKRCVLEDWIYLYYLNSCVWCRKRGAFLRIEFICIIWTMTADGSITPRSWGLNLFVLFEQRLCEDDANLSSWGLNLFVLFDFIYLVLY